jgi:hypothetical protein
MRIFRSIIAVSAVLALVGCMTVQPLPVNREQLATQLEPGDKVEVVTKDGRHLKFAMESVDEQGLRGAGQQIAYADIESLSRSQLNVGRTALIVLGVVAVGAAAAGGGGGGGSGY